MGSYAEILNSRIALGPPDGIDGKMRQDSGSIPPTEEGTCDLKRKDERP